MPHPSPEWQHLALYAVGAALLIMGLQRVPYVGRFIRFAFSETGSASAPVPSTIRSEIADGSSLDEQAQMIIVKFMIQSHRDLQILLLKSELIILLEFSDLKSLSLAKFFTTPRWNIRIWTLTLLMKSTCSCRT